MGKYGTIGLEIFFAVGIGFWFGQFIDRKLESAPWGLLFFGLCGVIAAGNAFYRVAKIFKEEMRKKDPE
jgi:F0F1-type ATP synthase assembly protein I